MSSVHLLSINLLFFSFSLHVRTLYPWREHLLHAVVTAELSSPCCILLPGEVELTADRKRHRKGQREKNKSKANKMIRGRVTQWEEKKRQKNKFLSKT